eukprot:TRINITY_DN5923_c0_g1_i1.p1 TRINITY_DN5923_c0_g1~~TRINITY_DN5923_c0_g1_i1.p1  ORF type:complete len:428 (+),score=108.64 TRINITY_DN5923_c0_g1_i1:90-1373(+)
MGQHASASFELKPADTLALSPQSRGGGALCHSGGGSGSSSSSGAPALPTSLLEPLPRGPALNARSGRWKCVVPRPLPSESHAGVLEVPPLSRRCKALQQKPASFWNLPDAADNKNPSLATMLKRGAVIAAIAFLASSVPLYFWCNYHGCKQILKHPDLNFAGLDKDWKSELREQKMFCRNKSIRFAMMTTMLGGQVGMAGGALSKLMKDDDEQGGPAAMVTGAVKGAAIGAGAGAAAGAGIGTMKYVKCVYDSCKMLVYERLGEGKGAARWKHNNAVCKNWVKGILKAPFKIVSSVVRNTLSFALTGGASGFLQLEDNVDGERVGVEPAQGIAVWRAELLADEGALGALLMLREYFVPERPVRKKGRIRGLRSSPRASERGAGCSAGGLVGAEAAGPKAPQPTELRRQRRSAQLQPLRSAQLAAFLG